MMPTRAVFWATRAASGAWWSAGASRGARRWSELVGGTAVLGMSDTSSPEPPGGSFRLSHHVGSALRGVPVLRNATEGAPYTFLQQGVVDRPDLVHAGREAKTGLDRLPARLAQPPHPVRV